MNPPPPLVDPRNSLKEKRYFVGTIVSMVVIAAFAAISTSFPLKNQLLSALYPKSESSAKSFDSLSTDFTESKNQGLVEDPQRVFQVELLFDVTAATRVSFAGITEMNAFPSPLEEGGAYQLEVIDNQDQHLAKYFFNSPEEEVIRSLSKGAQEKKLSSFQPQSEFIVTIPFDNKAQSLQVRRVSDNTIVSTRALNGRKKLENKPEYKSIRGSYLIQPRPASLVRPASAYTGNGKIDFVMIGDNYTAAEMSQFRSLAQRSAQTLISQYQPYKERADQIVFHFIETTVDLGCRWVILNEDATCNESSIFKVVNQAGVQYESVNVFMDDMVDYSAASSRYAMIEGEGTVDDIAHIFVHEQGHQFAGLDDEYIYDDSKVGVIDNKVHGGNCYAGSPPAVEWSGIVSAKEYFKGCTYPNWYRASENSIMKDLDAHYFNLASIYHITNRMNLFAPSRSVPATPTPTPTPSKTPTPTPFVRNYTFKVEFVCPNGGTLNDAAYADSQAYYMLWDSPASPVTTNINAGVRSFSVVPTTKNSGATFYIGMKDADAGVTAYYRPTGTSPLVGITYGTYWTDARPMAKWTLRDVPSGSYTFKFDGGSAWCVMPAELAKLQVTSPNGGEAWADGSTQTVRWSFDDSSVEPISTVGTSVDIYDVSVSPPKLILTKSTSTRNGANGIAVAIPNTTAGNRYKAKVALKTEMPWLNGGGYSFPEDWSDTTFTVGTAVATPVPTTPPSNSGTNLLLNPSFELDSNNDGKSDSWSIDGSPTRSSEQKQLGSYSMRHYRTDNISYTINQRVSGISSSYKYNFSGWVNIPATSDAFTFRYRIAWRNSSDAIIRSDTVKEYKAATSGWQFASAAGLIPPSGAVSAQIRMEVESLSAKIYVDNVVFSKL